MQLWVSHLMSYLIPALVAFKCTQGGKVKVLTLGDTLSLASFIFYRLLIFSSVFWKFFIKFFWGRGVSKKMSHTSQVACGMKFFSPFPCYCFLSSTTNLCVWQVCHCAFHPGSPLLGYMTPLPWSGLSCLFCRNGTVILMLLMEITSLLTNVFCWAAWSAFFHRMSWPPLSFPQLLQRFCCEWDNANPCVLFS